MPRTPKQKAWLYPAGAERDYLADIRRIAVRPVEQGMREFVFPMLDGYFREDVDPRDLPQSTGWFEQLRQALIATLGYASQSEQVIRAVVDRIGRRVTQFNQREFRAVLRSVYAVDVITPDPPLAEALRVWEAENIGLIRSIPQQAVSRMQGTITEAVRTGQTLQTVKAQIREEFGVTDRRATLIARDQIGKLNGQLTQLRQESIGVDSYTWRGILDARERPEHVAREGKVFQWSKPPDDGHPGQPIRCRCSAAPVLPSWEEMETRITGRAVPAGTYQ